MLARVHSNVFLPQVGEAFHRVCPQNILPVSFAIHLLFRQITILFLKLDSKQAIRHGLGQ